MIQSLTDIDKQQLSKQIFLNHIDLYIERLGPPQTAYRNLNQLINSKDYRVGRFMMSPLRLMKRLFNELMT